MIKESKTQKEFNKPKEFNTLFIENTVDGYCKEKNSNHLFTSSESNDDKSNKINRNSKPRKAS